MSEFHALTAATFSIDDCQYNSIGKNGPVDSGPWIPDYGINVFKDCKQLWYPKMTYFGQCLQFSTFNLDQKESDVGKKEIQMS